MKKIAFYVEGLTEQIFINRLIIEIVARKNIEIIDSQKRLCLILQKFEGKGRVPKIIYPTSTE